MVDDLLTQAAELRARREPFVLATVVACRRPTAAYPGAKAIIEPSGTFTGWVGGSCAQPIVMREALKALEDGQPRLLRITPDPLPADETQEGVLEFAMPCESQGALEVYIEPSRPRPVLLVIGETPLAQTLARAGSLIDFAVCASDPAATSELFPDAETLLTGLDEVPAQLHANSYVVVATQGQYDEDALAAVIRSDAAYIGLIASKRRADAVFEYLRDQGVESALLERVHCPAGLDLGGVTPQEIALSIVAEMLQIRRSAATAVVQTESSASIAAEALEVRDPVCGMTVEIASARYTSEHDGRHYYFCNVRCQESFQLEPARYLAAPPKPV